MIDITESDRDGIARRLGSIAAEAGRLLDAVADRSGGHRLKDDGSPATDADLRSEELILARLRESWPGIPVVAEEGGGRADGAPAFFLVDPLDGTRDFLTGTGEYSVNIALVLGERPAAAALAAPASGQVWIAGATAWLGRMEDAASGWSPTAVRRPPPAGLVALVSRRHGDDATEACMAALPVAERRTASSAVKFGLLASGEADLYIRCGPTMEWDTAAGDHILTAAGGLVIGPDGGPLTYGHAGRGHRNGPFAAVGDPALAGRIRLPAAEEPGGREGRCSAEREPRL